MVTGGPGAAVVRICACWTGEELIRVGVASAAVGPGESIPGSEGISGAAVDNSFSSVLEMVGRVDRGVDGRAVDVSPLLAASDLSSIPDTSSPGGAEGRDSWLMLFFLRVGEFDEVGIWAG